MLKVAFQGERGAFSEDAVINFFGENVDPLPCFSFSDVFDNVSNGTCEFGVVPVENSQAGSINETYDLLLNHPLTIYGELDLIVNLCIMALPGETMKTIKRIYSHPKALAQCDQYLQQINAEIVPTYDTSGSAKMIRETRLRNSAAVASERAAKLYQMEILECNIQTVKDNYTKFFVISKKKPEYSKKSKTSIVFKTDNKVGALYSCLGAFATRHINLTKIESRPTKDKPWEYLFYVDFEGHVDDDICSKAIEELKNSTIFLKILGSYPKKN